MGGLLVTAWLLSHCHFPFLSLLTKPQRVIEFTSIRKLVNTSHTCVLYLCFESTCGITTSTSLFQSHLACSSVHALLGTVCNIPCYTSTVLFVHIALLYTNEQLCSGLHWLVMCAACFLWSVHNVGSFQNHNH